MSSDGTTTKLLVRLQDGMQVEAVVMTYTKGGESAPPRALPPHLAPALLHKHLVYLWQGGCQQVEFEVLEWSIPRSTLVVKATQVAKHPIPVKDKQHGLQP